MTLLVGTRTVPTRQGDAEHRPDKHLARCLTSRSDVLSAAQRRQQRKDRAAMGFGADGGRATTTRLRVSDRSFLESKQSERAFELASSVESEPRARRRKPARTSLGLLKSLLPELARALSLSRTHARSPSSRRLARADEAEESSLQRGKKEEEEKGYEGDKKRRKRGREDEGRGEGGGGAACRREGGGVSSRRRGKTRREKREGTHRGSVLRDGDVAREQDKPRFLTPSSFLHEMHEDVVEGAKSCDRGQRRSGSQREGSARAPLAQSDGSSLGGDE